MTKRANKKRWPLAIVMVAICLVTLYAYRFRSGIEVTIHNKEAVPLRSVVLHVTGKSYPLGTIAAGDSALVAVNPVSESSLKIDFTQSDGKNNSLDADVYFEANYRGTMRISIRDGKIDENVQDIRPAP